MRWSTTVTGVVLWLSAVGCGSSPAKGTDAGIDLGIDLGVDMAGTDGPTTGNTVQATGSVHNVKNARIAGARVCIVDHPEIACATADASGNYTLTVPASTTPVDIAFNVTAAGYLGFTGLVHQIPGSAIWPSAELYDDASATTLMNQAGFTYPAAGTACAGLTVLNNSVGAAEGVTVSSAPAGAVV